jgi:triacylglycerol lipase
MDKGKGRQEPTLDSLIDEAISSPLSTLSIESAFDHTSPISPLPQAHYPSSMTGLGRPRLVSQLTRSTMPTASLAYAPDGTRV